jgi:thiamine pyrophosphate-dependent acetolactate synthase large subunit-like protein
MNASAAIAEILKREGVEILFAYPRNKVIEASAEIDIRPIIVRQERIAVHMADAIARLSRGKKIGVFACQHGPGIENAYGSVAQAYSESIPLLILPGGYATRIAHVKDNFNSTIVLAHVSKHAEPITSGAEVPNIMRRAFSLLRNGRHRPVVVEIPNDLYDAEVPEPLDYEPVYATRSGPDPDDVKRAAKVLVDAKRLVIYAGAGIHWGNASAELQELAELLGSPVCTSLEGKSAFNETHPLSIGAGGAAMPKTVRHFLDSADVIFGAGCSFSESSFAVKMPKGKTIVHLTSDGNDLNKSVRSQVGLTGDSQLALRALVDECRALLDGTHSDPTRAHAEIRDVEAAWLAEWMPKLTSNESPLSPYRVLWDLQNTVDKDNTIITHDAGSPRDQLTPYWKSTAPLSYLGWGKTTQLGYGLGLAMGAKLACPDKLCINVWGDAAIGFTGMDFETAVRERIPILSILLNNSAMAIELDVMPAATEKFRSTDISGNYAAMTQAFGGYGERVTKPEDIIPAIKRGIEQTKAGKPVLLEFITAQETKTSRY